MFTEKKRNKIKFENESQIIEGVTKFYGGTGCVCICVAVYCT
jgi:hypothetical protein